ncbi:hypothetical protein M1L60_45420 [Actinoplanes sp. TRM 88003]|uniref:Uncharacterized protein n=1 Tax=Paractinoplanes aksuensis TaxID=2939490 RepID=A0ABT1E3W9_9ACTN|nr:hypothetical protein [Actinoplanes aksuensis]MCO8277835.1 hypothetical protein [Actinoplanes aksuensis]
MAMVGGYVLAERQRANGDGATNVGSQSESPAPAFTPPGPFCPDQTEITARKLGFSGDLWQVLKIYTDNDSTYWICQDVAGKLFYQSKTGGIDAELVEGRNGLFLKDVRRIGTDTYEVFDQNENRFVITPSLFELTFAKTGKTQRNEARLAG